MNTILTLPDGTAVGTGLQTPASLSTAFPLYEDAGPMLTDAQIEAEARSGKCLGRTRFDSSWIGNQRSHGSCFPPGTFVRMADGSQKPIEDVRLFDRVLTAEGRQGTVVTLYGKQAAGLHSIQLWGHNLLRCTAEHPILTRRGYVAAQDVRLDDWIAVPRYAPQTEKFLHTADYLPPGREYATGARYRNAGVVGRGGIDVAVVPIPDMIEMTPEVGYIFGLFLAEGNTDRTKVVWSFNADEEHTLVAELQKNLRDCWGVESHLQRRGNSKCIKVVVYGTRWAKLFEGLFATGSGCKKVPPVVCSGPRPFLESILRGWLDGDGHARRNEVQGVTVSRALALAMFDIGNAVGRNPALRRYRAYLTHHVKTRRPRYEVTFTTAGYAAGRMEPAETAVWRKVRGVSQEDYTGPVYNLEVEGDNSYVADGIGVHNCNGFAGAKALQRARVRRGLPRVNLSGAYLYSLVNGGQDNGSMLDAGMAAIQSRGVATEETVGWDAIYPSRYDRAKADGEAAKHKGFECYAVRTRQALFSALALGFDCVVAVHADDGYMQLDGEGIAGGGQGPGNHAVGCDGLGWSSRYGVPLADQYGSWDVTAHDRGRLFLSWNRHFAPTTNYHVFYAIRSTTDGGESPPAAT